MTRHLMTRPTASTMLGRCPGLLLMLVATMIGLGALFAPGLQPASAQEITDVRTTPIDGEIPQRWPRTVIASFPVEIDPDASTLRLVDIYGEDVPATTLNFTADGLSMSLSLPSDVPDGVYSMVWDATTLGTQEPVVGYSTFSVGNPEDAGIITIPSTAGASEGPAQWLQAGARWSALLGVIAAISVWPAWTLIVRPAIRPIWRRGPGIMAAIQQFAFIAFSLAFLGSLLELVVHSQTMQDGTWLDKLMNTVGNTDWGFWWLVRMLLLIFLGIGLAVTAWWFPGRRPVSRIVAWVLSLLVPVTFSLTSHATDDSVGRVTSIATDYLHMLFAGLWGGSLVILGSILLPELLRMSRGSETYAFRTVFGQIATRFGGLTLVSWLMLAATGTYAAWLFVGNGAALTGTDYGRALLIKLILVAVTIVLVGVGIVLMRRMATSPDANTSRLRGILIAQAVLVAVILLTVGQMNTTPTARDVITERSNQTAFQVDFPERPSLYLVAPGRVGVNHLRLEIPGQYIPNDAEAFVTISSPDYPEIGTKEFQMYRVPGNAFEHHGTEFALVGNWDVTLRLVEPGFDDLTYAFSQEFAEENTSTDIPANPWRFETLGGTAALFLLLVGVAGIAIAIVSGRGPTRKEAGGLGMAALALAAVLLLQARFDPVLAVSDEEGAINPNDLAMVARGEQVYDTYCMNCHGPELRGDGPLNESLDPPAADFAAPHTFVHSDNDLIYWIQNGKQGTAMPGFAAQLTDQEMRDVIAFIQNWQANYDPSQETAESAPLACEVAPITFAEIPEIFHHGIMPDIARGTPLIQAANAAVDGDTANDVMWTVEQMVACTNSDESLSRLRLYSDPLLQEVFPSGADQRLTSATTRTPQPLGPGEQVSIGDVQSIFWLADGRVAVSVIFEDPAGVGIVPGANPITQVTLIMIQEDGAWIVDEVR